MTNAEIVSILRDVYGLKEAEYPTATLNTLITQAVKKISPYYPEIKLTYIDTVKDQSRYTVTHDGLIKIREVYYAHNNTVSNFFENEKIHEINVDSLSTYLPSMKYADSVFKEMLRTLYPVGADIIDVNSFDLIPAPSDTGGRVYYEYEKFRTIANTPSIFEDDICQLVIWFLGQRQYIKEVSTTGGNSYMFDRRGNTQKQANIASAYYKQRQEEFNNIIAGIQKKLLGIQ